MKIQQTKDDNIIDAIYLNFAIKDIHSINKTIMTSLSVKRIFKKNNDHYIITKISENELFCNIYVKVSNVECSEEFLWSSIPISKINQIVYKDKK